MDAFGPFGYICLSLSARPYELIRKCVTNNGTAVMGSDDKGAGATGEQQQEQASCTSGSGQEAGSAKEAALLKATVESLRAGLREKEDTVTELASDPTIDLCLVKFCLLGSYRVHAHYPAWRCKCFPICTICMYVRFCCRRNKGHLCVATRTAARKPGNVLISLTCK